MLGSHALLDADIYVLCHDDSIIDHQPHGQYDSQHREHVDREAGDVHDEKCTDERYRYHDARNQRNPPVAQEQENNDDNEYECLVNSAFDLVYGSTDKFRIVETVSIFHIFGQVFFHRFHAFIYSIGDFDVVGARLRNDDDTHHGDTVHLHITFQVLRFDIGRAYITETYDAASILFHDDIVEFFGRMHQT